VIAKVMDAVTGAAGEAFGSPGIGELTSGVTDAVQKGVSGATDRIKKKAVKVPRELSINCLVTSTQIVS